MNELELLDWKRRIFELYAEVRAAPDPGEAWEHWRSVRDELYRTHPQSPLTQEAREGFSEVPYFPYDPALRVLADVDPVAAEVREIAGTGEAMKYSRQPKLDVTTSPGLKSGARDSMTSPTAPPSSGLPISKEVRMTSFRSCDPACTDPPTCRDCEPAPLGLLAVPMRPTRAQS